MTHAMVISGVHLDPKSGKPLRYKVENSWGENSGDKGFFVMTDRWFEQYVYSRLPFYTLGQLRFCLQIRVPGCGSEDSSTQGACGGVREWRTGHSSCLGSHGEPSTYFMCHLAQWPMT
jgi:hypothetical protein